MTDAAKEMLELERAFNTLWPDVRYSQRDRDLFVRAANAFRSAASAPSQADAPEDDGPPECLLAFDNEKLCPHLKEVGPATEYHCDVCGRNLCAPPFPPETDDRVPSQAIVAGGVREAISELTKLAAECHRTKWQFDFNDEARLNVGRARDLIKRAFQELHRIGDLALKARDALLAPEPLRQRNPRTQSPHYLAWLRTLPCACGCGSPPPSDAAHIRSGSLKYEKPPTGLSEKPSDRWAVALNRSCHRRQHAFGSELSWWEQHGKDPFALALRYNERYTHETGKAVDAPAKKRRPRTTIVPKGLGRPPQRKRIQSRGFPKGGPKRKISSRGFR
jgi:hypothetical protein